MGPCPQPPHPGPGRGPELHVRERPEAEGGRGPGSLDGRQQTALSVCFSFPRRQLRGRGGETGKSGAGWAQLRGGPARSSCVRPPEPGARGADVSPERPPIKAPLPASPLPAAQRGRRRPEGRPASCWLPRARAWPCLVGARRQVLGRGRGVEASGMRGCLRGSRWWGRRAAAFFRIQARRGSGRPPASSSSDVR